MYIGTICNREVVTTNKETAVSEVARLMRVHHVGSVVVMDETPDGARPIGIITDRDLVIEVLAQQVPLEAISLKDIMTSDLVVSREDEGVWETMQRMRDRGVRRSPVVDAEGVLVGLVSVDDLLDLLAEELTDLVKLINREQHRERKARAMG